MTADGLEQEGLTPAFLVGTSIGGLVAARALAGLTFGGLAHPLAVVAVDVAAMAEPDLVVAVRAGGHRHRAMPALRGSSAAIAIQLGQLVPNPMSARTAFEILVRSTEIALDRQNTLAAAMVEPHVLVDATLGDIGLRDFDRLDEAVAAGRLAAREALPALRRALQGVEARAGAPTQLALHVDPVCDMVVSPGRAAAVFAQGEQTFYFCSVTCRDAFLRRLAGGADGGSGTRRPPATSA